jgi:hypothetical protein
MTFFFPVPQFDPSLTLYFKCSDMIRQEIFRKFSHFPGIPDPQGNTGPEIITGI